MPGGDEVVRAKIGRRLKEGSPFLLGAAFDLAQCAGTSLSSVSIGPPFRCVSGTGGRLVAYEARPAFDVT